MIILLNGPHWIDMTAKWFQLWVNAALDFIYPHACICCHCELSGGDELLCQDCGESLHHIHAPICQICGSPVLVEPSQTERCANCLAGTHYFDQIRAELDYNGEHVQGIIHAYKFDYLDAMAKGLSVFLIQAFETHYANELIHAVIPVPLHKSRHRQREFNQSALLAKHLSTHTGIPMQEHWVIRNRQTQPQTKLKPDERIKNMHDAFSVSKPDEVKDKILLIIDDVVTTGSTVNELSRVLREHGAKRILVLALARAYAQIKLR